jgi:predicted nucleic acid-binding protein
VNRTSNHTPWKRAYIDEYRSLYYDEIAGNCLGRITICNQPSGEAPMKQYLVDTNALISFVTDRDPEQQEKVARLFESARNLKAVIFCHQHVLTEFIYVMDRIYNVSKDQINRMVSDLMEMPGIETIQEIDLKAALSFWPDPGFRRCCYCSC